MPLIQTWDGIIAGEQINPPEYRYVRDDDPRHECNLEDELTPIGLQITAASYQKTAAEIAFDIALLEEAQERKAARDRAVQLAISCNERFARSCKRKPRTK